ncbi:MAG: hypothetical protein SFX72_04165 [Isosphaeraceae bacterium]|nr:hypothetical protein [Isosphaeraceae bacterium]
MENRRIGLVGTGLCLFFAIVAGRPIHAGSWVLPDRQMGRHTAPLLVLSRPEVQADLQLDAAKAASLDQVIVEIYAKARDLRGRRDADAVNGRRAIDEMQQAWLDENLTEPQRSRLVQLDLQWEGPAALHTRNQVADTLRLTDTQKAAVAKAVKERESLRAQPERDSRADDVALATAVLAALDGEQRERWKSMLGRPCAFKALEVAAAR